MNESKPRTKSVLSRVLGSEVLLGTLVALLSLLAALASYQGSLADSAESDANFEGQKVLSESNTEYLLANSDVIQDYTMYDGFFVNEFDNPEVADYYRANFSLELEDSLDRPDGPWDDQYYDEMYAETDDLYDEALLKFEEAQAAGDRADRFELVVLTFAVGLALAAWASINREESLLRPVFAVISIFTLVYGLVLFIGVLSRA